MNKPSVAQTHSYLIAEWADEKDLSTVSAGSGYIARWKCVNHSSHIWNASVKNRVKGSHCPYCSGKKVLIGYNDLLTTHPDVAAEWGAENSFDPTSVSAGSNKRVQWTCSHDSTHTWHTTVHSRAQGSQCPYCSGLKVIIGETDIATTHPVLAEEWSRRNTLKPTDVSAASSKKVEWVCRSDSSHVWLAVISSRGKKENASNCPYCSGNKAIAGENDIPSTHPDIASEWADKRDVSSVSAGSEYEARWKCSLGHVWFCSVYKRTKLGRECDVCNNRTLLKGFNDLETTHPALSAEWSDDNPFSPQEAIAGSGIRVKWVCRDNSEHTWETMIANRTKTYLPTGCPVCFAKRFTSNAEDEIYDYIENIVSHENITVLRSVRNIITPNEIDIYIPEKNLAIEYNGVYWHSEQAGKDKWYHYNKYIRCKEKGIQLFQIWEDDYVNNPALVKTMIDHKLGVNNDSTVFARKTYYQKIGKAEAKEFLNKNHLQGMNYASTYFGLRDTDNRLVCILGCQKVDNADNGYNLEISRFAVDGSVPGGFSKLLKNTLKNANYSAAKNIISYSHNDHSWGKVYEKNGFTKDHDGAPGYFYIQNGKIDRRFRRNYTISNFKKNPDLVFEENLSERQLAAMNKLYRVWDSGSTKWIKETSPVPY